MTRISEPVISVIIPARNEEGLVGLALEAVIAAAGPNLVSGELPHLHYTNVEVIVVDNFSTDRTAVIAQSYRARLGVQLLFCTQPGAPCARNLGARHARGQTLVFIDADTVIPSQTLQRIRHWCGTGGYQAGITALASLEGGKRAWCWWTFWGHIRRLPLPRAKAMPAVMFCTRDVFQEYGPFDERVAIGEEWPILAGLYRAQPERFIYDRGLVALTSSRRMELQPFGYVRTFLKYLWAILHVSGRTDYGDAYRYTPLHEKGRL